MINNKKIEKFIKNNVNIKSKDFFEKLSNSNNEINFGYYRVSRLKKIITPICCSIILFIVTFNIHNFFDKRTSYEKSYDVININEMLYDNGEASSSNIVDSITGIISKKENVDIVYDYYNIFFPSYIINNYQLNVICNYHLQQVLPKSCSIELTNPSEKIYIEISKDEMPLFYSEYEDMWSEQKNLQNVKYSQLDNKKIIIIKATNDIDNYKTKFKINDINISVDAYGLELNKFLDIIKETK